VRLRGGMGRSAAVVSGIDPSGAALAVAVGATAGAESREKSYEEEGEHEYVVPAGICWVTVEASGAEGGDVCRRIAVGRFTPALGAADHATGNHRQAGLFVKPVAACLVKGQFKTVGAFPAGNDARRLGQLHDPRRQRTLFEHLATFGKFVST